MTKQISPKHIILYADDDEDDRLLLEDSFMPYSSNIEMVCMVNGFEVISYLESLHVLDPMPCLVILDINMPLIDGKEALKKIRSMNRFKDVPVILFTTSSQEKDKFFAEKHNAGFLTKPIDAEQMKMIADTFIEHCTEDVKKDIRRSK